jgi:tetratricopeptide (TPR) repeat protein
VRLRSIVLGSALFLGAAHVSTVSAQETKSPAVSARAAYQEGIDLVAQGKLAEAEAKFLEAWTLQKSYDVAANLGEVAMRLGKPAEAAFYFKYALESFPASGKEDKRVFLEKRLAEARSKAAVVKVIVNLAGAEVKINGKPAGKAPLGGEVFVPAGDCTVEVTAPEMEPFVQTIRASEGGSHEVRAELLPPAKSPVPAVVVGGAGVIGLAAGIALFVVSNDKYEQAKKLHDEIAGGASGSPHCAPGKDPHPRCGELKSTAELSDALYTPGVALMVGGAVLTAAGAAYLGYTLSSVPAPSPSAASGRPAVTRVGLRGTGLFVQGTF